MTRSRSAVASSLPSGLKARASEPMRSTGQWSCCCAAIFQTVAKLTPLTAIRDSSGEKARL